jgi:tetratricopeptide (TPR) repeat protein
MKLNQNDLKTLLETTDSKVRNLIIDQLKNDELSGDALDGILCSDLNSTDFLKLDKRFNQKSQGSSYLKWSTFILIAIIFSTVLWFQKNEKTNPGTNAKKLSSNNILDEKNSQKRVNESLQLKPQTKSEVESASNVNLNAIEVKQSNTSENLSDNLIGQDEKNQDEAARLSTRQTGLIPSTMQYFKGETGSEVLMVGLKTIDYRVYRKKIEKLEPMSLSNGTTANFEGKNGQMAEKEFESKNYFDYLNESLNLFQKGLFSMAISNFESILATYDDDLNALFYGGLSHFNLKKYDQAMTYFEKAMNNRFSNFREEIEWNLLLVYVEIKNFDKANKIKSEIINKNGFYAKRASQLNF